MEAKVMHLSDTVLQWLDRKILTDSMNTRAT